MPAMVDDPVGPTIYRVSGQPPYPNAQTATLPTDILPRQVTLRDRQTVATIVPFASRDQIPASLAAYLCHQLNKEIEGGDTYPMLDSFTIEGFTNYWFQNFGAVMILGIVESAAEVVNGEDWAKECLGSFYIKPNYPGRSSHVCNAGFLVTDAARNRGVGRLMGESYIVWAPRLGYTYSVFNLVYETNVASCKIWDALGFKRIGRVKGCGNLKSYPDRLIDAIIYGRDLAPGEGEDIINEERFDKIKYYLKYNKYPNGADRAEKSRLRSAATHYKLLEGDKLMLKGKEVISDPARQYDIATSLHMVHHAGINKTTATIAEKYHWSRIKETVSDVIRNCSECKELNKTPSASAGVIRKAPMTTSEHGFLSREPSTSSTSASRVLALQSHDLLTSLSATSSPSPGPFANPSELSGIPPSHTLQPTQLDHSGQQHQPPLILHDTSKHNHSIDHHQNLHQHQHEQHHHPENHSQYRPQHQQHHNPMLQDQPFGHESSVYQPIDPQIIDPSVTQQHGHHQPHNPHHIPHHHHHHSRPEDNPFEPYHAHADFQALLNATEEDESDDPCVAVGIALSAVQHQPQQQHEQQQQETNDDAVDRDLEMLIDHQQDDGSDDGGLPGDTTHIIGGNHHHGVNGGTVLEAEQLRHGDGNHDDVDVSTVQMEGLVNEMDGDIRVDGLGDARRRIHARDASLYVDEFDDPGGMG